jgi:biotin operon repressor
MSKYLESKKGSIEELSTKIASEQPTIDRTFKSDVKLTTEKKYLGTKPGSLADAAAKVVSESKLDPVNKDAVKKKFDDRKDKDIDNDGDVDSSDKFLHKRRKAISKAMTEDDMGKFHKMQKDGKSAEQIAKALDIDVKSTKKLMDSVRPDDKGEKINQKKHDGYKDPKKGEKEIIKPIKEGRMKEIAIDMKDLSAEQFKAKYGESKAEMQKKLGKPENEKSFKDMRKEMNKTMTGKKIATVDTQPQSERI